MAATKSKSLANKLPTFKDLYGYAALLVANVEDSPKSFPFCHDTSILGVEVEVENVRVGKIHPESIPYWSIHNDGSLRNNGVEFITLPFRSKDTEPVLAQLFSALPAHADFSGRTSIHVHLNMRVWNPHQLYALMLTYLCVEKLLFHFVGQDRYNNIHCVPLGESMYNHSAQVQSLLAIKGVESMQNHKLKWLKYSALNLLPLVDKGTIEFRQMPGTRDLGKIFRWINLILRLKNWGYFQKSAEILTQIQELNTTSKYLKFVTDVFHEDTDVLIYPGFEKDMEQSIAVAKHILIHDQMFSSFKRQFADLIQAMPKPTPRVGVITSSAQQTFNAIAQDLANVPQGVHHLGGLADMEGVGAEEAVQPPAVPDVAEPEF